MKKLALLSSMLVCFLASIAQGQSDANSISVAPTAGMVFSNYDVPVRGTVYGGQVTYALSMSNNSAPWIQLLHVSAINLSAQYLNMQHVSFSGKRSGISDVPNGLGNEYDVNASLSIALYQTGRTQCLLSPGTGLAYVSQTTRTNGNPITGSHINLISQIGFGVQTPLSQYANVYVGINASHTSNGDMTLPNVGINTLRGIVAISTYVDEKGPNNSQSQPWSDDKHSFEFDCGIGRRGVVETGYSTNPTTGAAVYATGKEHSSNLYHAALYAGYNYRLNPILGFKLGTDVVYNAHTFSWNDFLKTYEGTYTSYDKINVGISAGTDLWLGRTVITASYGYYVHSHFMYDQSTYWKVGCRYFIVSWAALSATASLHNTGVNYTTFGLVFMTNRSSRNAWCN